MSLFSKIPVKKPRRNLFNLGFDSKLSCNMGQLVPILVKPVIPGDTFQNQTEIFLRFAPMLAPIMHSVYITTHFFFVPNRLVWNEWEDFITGGKDGTASPVFPRLNFSSASVINSYLRQGQLADYMGIPTAPAGVANTTYPNYVSALPFRAYQLIYNEYYRDQNLIDEVEFSRDSGVFNEPSPEYASLLTLRNRCWQKDYFTSALPWAQRGEPVGIPLSGAADIIRVPNLQNNLVKPDGTSIGDGVLKTANFGDLYVENPSGVLERAVIKPEAYRANLSTATSVTVNDLRAAQKLQEWLTKNARGGARYTEQILNHFGVRSSDARLQRPEFLGGGMDYLAVSEVLQTSATQQDTTPLGDFAGHGVAQSATHTFRKFFEEHGYIIGILSIMPKTAYQQGIPKDYFKFDKMDFYFPEFAHLGEQEIKTKELYLDYYDQIDPETNIRANENTFGYTPRYAEYKFSSSEVHGDFRSSLDYWHLGRIFSNTPKLNKEFVTADPSTRIFAVQDKDISHCWIRCYHNLKAIRPMPKYGVPIY